MTDDLASAIATVRAAGFEVVPHTVGHRYRMKVLDKGLAKLRRDIDDFEKCTAAAMTAAGEIKP